MSNAFFRILFGNNIPDHQVDRALPFTFDAIALALQACAHCVGLRHQSPALFIVFAGISFDKFRRV
ncbi:hypothetical protein [Mesorhizobium sp.]|uniref:hypothetical protein n=1 Tax=Mesorhizobium sp. TaxID=1871066 RepID=UPI0034399858